MSDKPSDGLRDAIVSKISKKINGLDSVEQLIALECADTAGNLVTGQDTRVASLREAHNKHLADLKARGVQPSDLEWIQAEQDYAEDRKLARNFRASMNRAATRIVDAVGK